MQDPPTTAHTDPKRAVLELVAGAPEDAFRCHAPDVYLGEDVPFGDRGPGQLGVPVCYVLAPDGGSHELHSADAEHLDGTDQVVVECWTLDQDAVHPLAEDVVDLLAFYANDNEACTPFHRIRPTGIDDYRDGHAARRTEHYVEAVDVELHRHRPLDWASL